MDWGGGMMGGPGFGLIGMIFSLIFMALFIAGFVLLVVWIVKQFAPNGASSTSSNALETLKERFAKGEISKEEFSEMKKELMK